MRLTVTAGFLVLLALPVGAAGVDRRASVSVTIPAITGVRVESGRGASNVSISLFRTTGVVILRSTADSQSPYMAVSLAHRPDTVAMTSGGWSTIDDEVRAPLQRVSTRGESSAGTTYEIWAF